MHTSVLYHLLYKCCFNFHLLLYDLKQLLAISCSRITVPLVTCLEDQQVQRVVSQVGGSSDLMRGNPHQQLLVIPPCQQQTASRQTQDAVLINAGLQRQHLQLLLTNTSQLLIVLHSSKTVALELIARLPRYQISKISNLFRIRKPNSWSALVWLVSLINN